MIYNLCTTAPIGDLVDVVDNFVKNTLALMAKRNIRQRDLANAINMSPTTVNSWFTKRSNVNFKNAQLIADFLEVDVYALCFDFSLLPKLDIHAVSTHNILKMPLYKLAAELGYPRFIQDVE